MIDPITKARPRPKLASPSVDPFALGLIRIIGPAYARIVNRLVSLNFIGGERFVEAARDFYEGHARLVLAFRHPYGDEPQIFTLAMHLGLPREARRLGRPLSTPPHCLFLHGYEVPLWSGSLVRWILPRSGAMPIYHVRMDGAGLRTIRRALLEGKHPLAIAPEGQTSYRSETLPRLERGALQFGFWCAEELAAAGRTEKVLVLPISVHLRHRESAIAVLEKLVADLETRVGLSTPATRREATERAMSGADHGGQRRDVGHRRNLGLRLRRLDAALLGLAESYYGLAGAAATTDDEADDTIEYEIAPAAIARHEARRAALLEEALRRGEAMLGIVAEGDLIARVYRIRHEGWNRIYPEVDLSGLPPLPRDLADRRAGEAWYAMRHMELVDLAFYLDAAYLEDGLRAGGAPSIGRLAETALNLADLASRLAGGDISHRPNVLDKHVVLVSRPPLEMTSRLPSYKTDRRGALADAETDLSKAYMEAIKEYRNEYRKDSEQ